MIKKNKILLLLACCWIHLLPAQQVKKTMRQVEKQENWFYQQVIANRSGNKIFPRSVEHDSLRLVPSGDWTSGFWPGILWLMYEYTQQQDWKTRAETFTALMEKEPMNRGSHDVGFKVFNSYGNGYRLTGKEDYKKQIIRAAATLASRFNPKVGCIRSWDFGPWQFPVIIDNMMNLELLFEATRISGDSSYYKIAVTHANTTLQNHFREDFSSYHLVDYDTITGKMISRQTVQGFKDESAWARGQAWGLYGFTMCYRETKNPLYLQQAEKISGFLISNPHLPADHIPYWDYNITDTAVEPRDASAAAIMASAWYELKNYVKHKKKYKKAANQVIRSLASHYMAKPGTHQGYLLIHSTGHKPVNGEVDVPLIYADYYFLEALLRKKGKAYR